MENNHFSEPTFQLTYKNQIYVINKSRYRILINYCTKLVYKIECSPIQKLHLKKYLTVL